MEMVGQSASVPDTTLFECKLPNGYSVYLSAAQVEEFNSNPASLTKYMTDVAAGETENAVNNVSI